MQDPQSYGQMADSVRKRGWAWGKKKRRWNENYGDWYDPKTGQLMTPDQFAAYHGYPAEVPQPDAESVPPVNVNHPDFSRMHPLHPANRDIAAPDPSEHSGYGQQYGVDQAALSEAGGIYQEDQRLAMNDEIRALAQTYPEGHPIRTRLMNDISHQKGVVPDMTRFQNISGQSAGTGVNVPGVVGGQGIGGEIGSVSADPEVRTPADPNRGGFHKESGYYYHEMDDQQLQLVANSGDPQAQAVLDLRQGKTQTGPIGRHPGTDPAEVAAAEQQAAKAVSYTHLTLPTIYSV